jgi:hypothetical protein
MALMKNVKPYTMPQGSFLLFTIAPFFHLSRLTLGYSENFERMNFDPA